MLSKHLLLVSSFLIVHASQAAAGPGCQGGLYADIAAGLVGFAPARSYCYSKYPLAPVTVTSTASTSTITSSATTTTTTIVPTSTSIVTTTTDTTSISTVTVTSTSTATSTSTNTVVTGANKAKRFLHPTTATSNTGSLSTKSTVEVGPKTASNPPTTLKTKTTVAATTPTPSTTSSTSVSPQQSAWSSILSKAQSIIGDVCTCLETAATSTTTFIPSTTVTSTSTITSSSTPITTSTAISTSTVTSTSTTTTVSTTTTTVMTTVTTCPNPNTGTCTTGQFTTFGGVSCHCYADIGDGGPYGPAYYVISGSQGPGCNSDRDCLETGHCIGTSGGSYCQTFNDQCACGGS